MAKHVAEYDYTDEELLALLRQAKADVLATGQATGIRGKTLTRANLAEINKDIRELQNTINRSKRGNLVLSRHSRR